MTGAHCIVSLIHRRIARRWLALKACRHSRQQHFALRIMNAALELAGLNRGGRIAAAAEGTGEPGVCRSVRTCVSVSIALER